MDVTVIVGTFGDPYWIALAQARAIPSAQALGVRVIHEHADALHRARNRALWQVTTPFVVCLDADDELDPGYVEAMATGTADLRAPAVSYVKFNGHARPPYVPKVAGHTHDCTGECLPAGNFLVVGSMARAQLLRDVGGWEDWVLYEDWALWLRCWTAGATVETIPTAIYIAHFRPDSRNRAPTMAFKNQIHHEIVTAILPNEAAVA